MREIMPTITAGDTYPILFRLCIIGKSSLIFSPSLDGRGQGRVTETAAIIEYSPPPLPSPINGGGMQWVNVLIGSVAPTGGQ